MRTILETAGGLILGALILTTVWLVAGAAYSNFVAVEPKQNEAAGGHNVLLALNARVEALLRDQVRTAEEEQRRLQALLASGDLNAERQTVIRRELEALQEEQRAVELQIEQIESEEQELIRMNPEPEAEQPLTISEAAAIVPSELESDKENQALMMLETALAALDGRIDFDAEELIAQGEAGTFLSRQLSNAQVRESELATRVEALGRTNSRISAEIRSAVGNLSAAEAEQERLNQQNLALEEQIAGLLRELEEKSRSIALLNAEREGLYSASELNGVFYGTDEGLRVAVHPDRLSLVLEQGTFNVHAPGEENEVKTRILISRTGEELDYQRYPGQREPEEGDWF